MSPWTTVDRAPTRLPSKILFQWIKSKINWYTNILWVIWISRFRSIERDSPMWCKSLVPHISQHVSLAALKSPGSLNFIHFNSLILLTLATDSNDAIWPAPQRSCANTLCEIYRKSANGTVNRRWWVVWWIDWRFCWHKIGWNISVAVEISEAGQIPRSHYSKIIIARTRESFYYYFFKWSPSSKCMWPSKWNIKTSGIEKEKQLKLQTPLPTV